MSCSPLYERCLRDVKLSLTPMEDTQSISNIARIEDIERAGTPVGGVLLTKITLDTTVLVSSGNIRARVKAMCYIYTSHS
jgi:hypothetical protein